VHSHILFDLNGMDEREFAKVINRNWNTTSRQVNITRLTDYYIDDHRFKHTVNDAIRNIANYAYNGSNAKLTYATNWGGSRKSYEQSKTVDANGSISVVAKGTKQVDFLDTKLPKGHLRFLIRVHNNFTDNRGRGLLVEIR
jgi:hypothetical protein